MGQPGNEPEKHSQMQVGARSHQSISDKVDEDEPQQDLMERALAGYQDYRRGAHADSEGIGRNEVAGFGDGAAQRLGHVWQDAHHGELCHAQGERTERQGYQTLFHCILNLFTLL